MTQPHYIDRKGVAEPSNETCQFDAGQPVSNPYKFAAEIAWLQEAARYFSSRPTGGEDAAHWSNVYNAENANKIAILLDALSSRPAPMEATEAATVNIALPKPALAQTDGYMAADELKAVIRQWLDADDPTAWGPFERALDGLVSGEPTKCAVCGCLSLDGKIHFPAREGAKP